MAVNSFELMVGTGVLEMRTDVGVVAIRVEPVATKDFVPWDKVAPRETVVPEGEIVLMEEGLGIRRIDPGYGEVVIDDEVSEGIKDDGEMEVGRTSADAKWWGMKMNKVNSIVYN